MELKEIFTFENLYDAYKECRKSKQHKGEVIRFETNLSSNISNLMNEIITKKYKLGKYKEFSGMAAICLYCRHTGKNFVLLIG